ncbi:major facilitator superfamily domain-containing protein [Aspergillus oleicola]
MPEVAPEPTVVGDRDQVLSYIDRANIGNANIEGMSEDLHPSGQQYNHGIAPNYSTLLTLRLLMGVFEAGLFPGAIIILNKWYSKFELGTRFSLFYIGAALAGAFSGIMAYGFAKMHGVGGLEGWRWIFIMEGLITVVVGGGSFFVLPDSPESESGKKKGWIHESEAEYIIARLSLQDRGGAEAHPSPEGGNEKISKKVFWSVIIDWQIYLIVLVYWSNTVPNYGLKFMMPQIIKNMGFTASSAQLLTIPPYIAGAISAYIFGLFSDRFKRRAVFIAVPQLLLITAYAILTPLAPKISSNIGPCFFAIILANIGIYPINPGATSWLSNNLSGPGKRAIGIAYATSLTNVGGIFASYILLDSEAPAYGMGFGVTIAMVGLGLGAVVGLEWAYVSINKGRERKDMVVQQAEAGAGGGDGLRGGAGRDANVEVGALGEGDRALSFRYTL